jgi:hypothetical protein
MNFFEYLNYPPLPQSIIDEILLQINTAEVPICEILLDGVTDDIIDWSTELGRPLSEVDQNTCRFHVLEPSNVIKEWVKQNIPEKVRKIHINAMTNGTHLVPHIDEIRIKALNYVIETGGSNVITSFYKVKEQYKHLKASPRCFIPLDRLDPIEQICIKKDSWHSLAVSNIHDVGNIETDKRRIILTLSVY